MRMYGNTSAGFGVAARRAKKRKRLLVSLCAAVMLSLVALAVRNLWLQRTHVAYSLKVNASATQPATAAPSQASVTPNQPSVTSPPTVTPTVTIAPTPTDPAIGQLAMMVGIKNVEVLHGLVNVPRLDSSLIIEMRYASSHNFVRKPVYSADVCALRPEAAVSLLQAQRILKSMGYRLKIWDAYRPTSAQELFQKLVKNGNYISQSVSYHCRGVAVDVTLCNLKGKELTMPSGFDDFSIKATRTNPKIGKVARKNMNTLTNAMVKAGFLPYENEWWHYRLPDSEKFVPLEYNLAKDFPGWYDGVLKP